MKKLVLFGMLFAHGIVVSMEPERRMNFVREVPPRIRDTLLGTLRSVRFPADSFVVAPCMCDQIEKLAVVDVRKRRDFPEDTLRATGLDKHKEKYGCLMLFHPSLSSCTAEKRLAVMQQAVHELTLELHTAIKVREPLVVKKKEIDQRESLSVTRLRDDVPREVWKLLTRELKHISCEESLSVMPFTCCDLPAPFTIDLRTKDEFQKDILVRTGLDEVTTKYACAVVFNPEVYALSRVEQKKVMADLAKNVSMMLENRVLIEKVRGLFTNRLQFNHR